MRCSLVRAHTKANSCVGKVLNLVSLIPVGVKRGGDLAERGVVHPVDWYQS